MMSRSDSFGQIVGMLPVAALVITSAAPLYAVEYLNVQQAQRICFPNATDFIEASILYTAAQKASIEKKSGVKVIVRGQQVWRAVKKGEFLGYFVLDYAIGKHLWIDYAVALNAGGEVRQLEILQYRESYGGEIRSEPWRKQFVGKSASSPLQLNQDIVNVSGATLSCRHVTEGVKRVLAIYETCLR